MARGQWRQGVRQFLDATVRRGRRSGHRPDRRPQFHRPWFEVLEGRLAPTVTLSISDPAPFPKPDTGQILGMFVVTRSGDLSPTVQVDYHTQDGTGANGAHAGVDYAATTGTLNFAPNQTIATIAVRIIGNNIYQADKTFTVNLTNPVPNNTSFAPQQTFSVGYFPEAVAAGDFNGDGEPDLAAANTRDNTVSVRLNTTPRGATTLSFDPQQTFATGFDPGSVAVGDFNGDGRPDLVISNAGSNTVSVLLNTTPTGANTPSFAPQQTFATGPGPGPVAVGDFNGDGKLDIAIANSRDNTVSVLLNTTPTGATMPSFAPQRTFTTSSALSSVAVGDFNGDGKPDLAATNGGFGTDTVSVLLNMTPTGATVPSFAAQRTFATGSAPDSVAVGDLNGDGKPDLAIANFRSGTVSVLLNTTPTGATTPTFAPQQTFAAGFESSTVVAGDFNGDGKPDLAIANFQSDTVSVLLNTTPTGATMPSFTPQQTFVTSPGPDSVAVGDFNGDGKPDFAVASRYSNTVSVLLNNEMPTQITLNGSPATGTILEDDAPMSIAVVAGTTPQSAVVNTAFAVPLAVDVRNAAGNLVQNISVTFTAPGNGPSGQFGSSNSVTVMTNAAGRATAPTFVANTSPGSYLMTARATGGSNPSTSFSLTNTLGPPATLTATAGSNQSTTVNTAFTVNLLATITDHYGNRIPGVTVTFTAPNNGASVTFAGGNTSTTDANGQVSKAITANTIAGTFSIQAVASGGSNPTTAFVNLTNTPAALSKLDVAGYPSPVIAGVPNTFTVTAEDPYGNTVPGYLGTVHFASSDPKANLPADYTFTAGDNSRHLFAAAFKTAGIQSLTATDTVDGITGMQAGIMVQPAAAKTLIVASFPSPVTAGTAGTFSVTAKDAYGNTATNYTGRVTFSSTDPQAELPATYTFTPADNGVHIFGGVLVTAGTQAITATDIASGSLSGTQSGIAVIPAAADHFFITTSVNSTVAGTPFDITVTVQDIYGNTVTGYTGTVTFSSADPYGATLPADYTFQPGDQGTATFPAGATLYTAGTWDVTATDTSSGIAGSAFVNVVAAPAAAFQVVAPTSVTLGTPFDVTVIAVDAYGNTDMNYTGTIHFTTSDMDPGVVLPPDYTFQAADAGMATFPGGVTLITPGDQMLTVTDVDSGITGSSTVTVEAGGTAPGAGRFGLGAAAFGPAWATMPATCEPAEIPPQTAAESPRRSVPAAGVEGNKTHDRVTMDWLLSNGANPVLPDPLVEVLVLPSAEPLPPAMGGDAITA